MIRYLTAGESHGKALNVIIEGFPSNLKINPVEINKELKRRQGGYGRGTRMKIESDQAEILSGIRFGKTLGSPISMIIQNRDWENWIDIMSAEVSLKKFDKITIPRPGHADLVGTLKYNFDDIRNSIERSSARETAARVAAGSIAKIFLQEFGIVIGSVVENIGGIYPDVDLMFELQVNKPLNEKYITQLFSHAEESQLRVSEKKQENKIISRIKLAKKKGDTLGGTFITVALGVPVGLGSFMQSDRKINAEIASAMMSINAVKGVEIGGGFSGAERTGSNVHDEIIIKNKKLIRKTNRAGGIEGGITNGMPLIVRSAMKPIATLMSPLKSIDLKTMKKVSSRRERSDFVAVPACAVISEHVLAWVLAKQMLLKFGGDSIEETKSNYKNYNRLLQKRFR
jgi:chorismate synthase